MAELRYECREGFLAHSEKNQYRFQCGWDERLYHSQRNRHSDRQGALAEYEFWKQMHGKMVRFWIDDGSYNTAQDVRDGVTFSDSSAPKLFVFVRGDAFPAVRRAAAELAPKEWATVVRRNLRLPKRGWLGSDYIEQGQASVKAAPVPAVPLETLFKTMLAEHGVERQASSYERLRQRQATEVEQAGVRLERIRQRAYAKQAKRRTP